MEKNRRENSEFSEEYFFAKNADMPVKEYLERVKGNTERFEEEYNLKRRLEFNIIKFGWEHRN